MNYFYFLPLIARQSDKQIVTYIKINNKLKDRTTWLLAKIVKPEKWIVSGENIEVINVKWSLKTLI